MNFNRFTSLLWALLCAPTLFAQLTIKLTSIPSNTPANANIYIVGTFNNSNPTDPTKIMTSTGQGTYSITLTPAVGEVKFKFTRGSWATVEGNATGGFLPDRTYQYNGQPTTLDLSILSWEDLGGTGVGGTAAPNVQVMDPAFYMPQLNRNRRIMLYLPPDYTTSNKRYPVLYMHDGQNLFDASTAPFGEWEVDETLNQLHQQGNFGCIVVGIDNGGGERINEYSPWVNPAYGGGLGDEYVDFIVNTLKPHIDSHYRTLPGRQATGIMGSSMGGLISMYALAERQDVFSKAGIFSPAFWFAGQSSATHVATNTKEGDVRVYFMSGADEEGDGNQSNYVVEDMQDVSAAMNTAGFLPGEKNFVVKADGAHSEWFWRREFGAAYQWLFSGVNATNPDAESFEGNLQIFPNPATDRIRFSGWEKASQRVNVQIFNAAGVRVRNVNHRLRDALMVDELPMGLYLLKATLPNGRSQSFRFFKN
ncbi:MAG: T9SS type A sorting domain-containing protein [Saprospiraceae bacterium]|nr:T9SS type A sorting domain-containing protein [Saprospiraceae bacterium]